MEREKLDIKNRYLAGEVVNDIAKLKGIQLRTIYFHLGVLTPQEKAMHAQNRWLRKRALPIDKGNIPLQFKREINNGAIKRADEYGKNVANFIES